MIDEKKLLTVLSGKVCNPPPIWFMRQAGRYLPEYRALRETAGSFWKLCFTPEWAAEVTLQPLRRFDLDAAIIFSDILILPHALGQDVTFLPHHGPQLTPLCLGTIEKAWQDKTYLKGLEPTLDALQIVRENLSSSQALIGFSGAPWTLATYMFNRRKEHDFEDLPTLFQSQRPQLTQVIDILVDTVAIYLLEQIKRGADVVKIFDSWAGLVPVEERETFILKPLSQIVNKIRQAAPTVPIIYFGRQISGYYPVLISHIPGLAFAFDQDVDPVHIRDTFQPYVPVQGNLDPVLLAEGGKALIEATDKLLETLSKGPYVFNLGHGVLPHTPIAHIETVIDKVKKR